MLFDIKYPEKQNIIKKPSYKKVDYRTKSVCYLINLFDGVKKEEKGNHNPVNGYSLIACFKVNYAGGEYFTDFYKRPM